MREQEGASIRSETSHQPLLQPPSSSRLVGKQTGYQKMAALKAILAPTDTQHRQMLKAQYGAAMKPPRAREHKDLQTWLNNWISLYEECRDVGIPRALDMRETFTDLINAIGQVSPEYRTYQRPHYIVLLC